MGKEGILMATWSKPISLAEFKRRLLIKDAQEGPKVSAWLDGLAEGFACPDHPDEPPSVEVRTDGGHVNIVCAPCRRARLAS